MTEQRNALIKVNKTKDEFIALASHQLRTPATAVKQYINLLMNEFGGPLSADQLQYLQIAYNSNERELSIINDLLKTAQIDSNKYQLHKRLHDIRSIIAEAVSDLESAFEQRRQQVRCTYPQNAINVFVDATEIKLVFVNLLENASKYSYPGTEINVAVTEKDKYVEIAIADNGVGISKDNQQRIFDKFTRVNNDLSDTVTGTGLGLYWVKQIVELHKGKVKLSSAPGEGSTFTVRLQHE
jgi:signal transduction histidine kinase